MRGLFAHFQFHVHASGECNSRRDVPRQARLIPPLLFVFGLVDEVFQSVYDGTGDVMVPRQARLILPLLFVFGLVDEVFQSVYDGLIVVDEGHDWHWNKVDRR